ncbi:MAG: polysaccharide deacetylase family protein [Ignavibacteriales bacterium]
MKYRKIKIIISFFYLALLGLKKYLLLAVGKRIPGRFLVLYYHSVKDGEKEDFARQMHCLHRMSKPVAASYSGEIPPGKVYTAITFDDGFRNIVKYAVPELIKLNIPFTVFLPSEFLSKYPGWKANEKFTDFGEMIMGPEDVSALPKKLALVGSHSVSHGVMTGMSQSEAASEMTRSKEYLKSVSGRKVEMFSFPYGEFNKNLVNVALKAGYKRIFTNKPEVLLRTADSFIIGRIKADPTDSPLEFKLKIAGAYGWLKGVEYLKEKLKIGKKQFQPHNKQGVERALEGEKISVL